MTECDSCSQTHSGDEQLREQLVRFGKTHDQRSCLALTELRCVHLKLPTESRQVDAPIKVNKLYAKTTVNKVSVTQDWPNVDSSDKFGTGFIHACDLICCKVNRDDSGLII